MPSLKITAVQVFVTKPGGSRLVIVKVLEPRPPARLVQHDAVIPTAVGAGQLRAVGESVADLVPAVRASVLGLLEHGHVGSVKAV